MTGLVVDVTHRQGTFRLRASFVSPPGLTTLFGRSGSGKTTLLRIIGGLTRPAQGRVVVDGVTFVDAEAGIFVPPHRRRVGYVFQEARLFPHLTVRQNLLFGAAFAPRGQAGPTLDEVVELLGIRPLLARRPARLSGGEMQRVAIGRALLARPRILLMDEPLASLDGARKAEILPFVERLRDEARIPIVYVSHGLAEVARLADTIVVLADGEVATSGPAGDILGGLDVPLLAQDRGAGCVLDATVELHDPEDGLTALSTPAGRFWVPGLATPTGHRLRLHILARDVMISTVRPAELSALNVLPGSIAEIGASDSSTGSVAVRLDCAGATIVARVTRRSVAQLGLVPGRSVFAIVKAVSLAGEGAAGGTPLVL